MQLPKYTATTAIALTLAVSPVTTAGTIGRVDSSPLVEVHPGSGNTGSGGAVKVATPVADVSGGGGTVVATATNQAQPEVPMQQAQRGGRSGVLGALLTGLARVAGGRLPGEQVRSHGDYLVEAFARLDAATDTAYARR